MASYLETAVDIAREAGALLAHYFERRIGFELKGDFDLVTEADRASERLIVERLRSHFPTHGIVAEEGGGHEVLASTAGMSTPSTAPPISPTASRSSTSRMGLEHAGEMIAGVIYDPIRQEMFAAERGGAPI